MESAREFRNTHAPLNRKGLEGLMEGGRGGARTPDLINVSDAL